MLFVGILFSVNAFGIITSKMIHINQKTIIDHPALNIVPNQLLANFISSTKELLVINGLRFCMNGIKWIPLFCIALFINFIVYKSIYLVIRKKERTPWISIYTIHRKSTDGNESRAYFCMYESKKTGKNSG